MNRLRQIFRSSDVVSVLIGLLLIAVLTLTYEFVELRTELKVSKELASALMIENVSMMYQLDVAQGGSQSE